MNRDDNESTFFDIIRIYDGSLLRRESLLLGVTRISSSDDELSLVKSSESTIISKNTNFRYVKSSNCRISFSYLNPTAIYDIITTRHGHQEIT